MVASTLSSSAGFVSVTWGDDSVHLLDGNMVNIHSFPVDVGLPSGVATDGSMIWVGSFSQREVVAYSFAGIEQFRWTMPVPLSIQGFDYLPGGILMAVDADTSSITRFDAFTGAVLGTVPAVSSSAEAIAIDGANVWQLVDSSIYLTRLSDGSVVMTIPNAAASEAFEGTGMASIGDDLMLVGESGNWYRVSKLDGSLLASGNNGLEMYDLQEVPAQDVPDSLPSATVLIGTIVAIWIVRQPRARISTL
jgi:hypothetical protein